MERRTEDPAELADLFRLDHLTTRMRRHAEGLIILSGAAPGRAWRRPVPLLDVVRAAVSEVEDYARVEVHRMPHVSVAGPAVADLTHLVAELVENATAFSPPHTRVHVRGEQVGNGYAVEIEDRGLGMGADAMADANRRIEAAQQLDLFDSDRLGLFVVSRLARRQSVRVSLRPSAYGGTTAVVLLPTTLLEAEPAGPAAAPREERPAARAPRDAVRPAAVPPAPPAVTAAPAHPVPTVTPAVRPLSAAPRGPGGADQRPRRAPDGLRALPAAGQQGPLRPFGAAGADPGVLRPTPFRSAAQGHAAAPPGPPAERPAGPGSGDPVGLPRRVRQASIAPQLRQAPAPQAPAARRGAAPAGRSPEEARAAMAAFQSGWARGAGRPGPTPRSEPDRPYEGDAR
ncbi:sensor histidine kinase [Peterkaempfera sp. SMS 1(5)a]|uniref:sensor histidine kinase n=1 Tax=Peterkaempfera podocarpi TaxID=3232308 RepID=UPI00366CB8BC